MPLWGKCEIQSETSNDWELFWCQWQRPDLISCCLLQAQVQLSSCLINLLVNLLHRWWWCSPAWKIQWLPASFTLHLVLEFHCLNQILKVLTSLRSCRNITEVEEIEKAVNIILHSSACGIFFCCRCCDLKHSYCAALPSSLLTQICWGLLSIDTQQIGWI